MPLDSVSAIPRRKGDEQESLRLTTLLDKTRKFSAGKRESIILSWSFQLLAGADTKKQQLQATVAQWKLKKKSEWITTSCFVYILKQSDQMLCNKKGPKSDTFEKDLIKDQL